MPKINIKFAGFFLGLVLTAAAFAAEPVAVNPAHPDSYTVVKGDTLWDIAGRFLRDPWRWPDVWHVNPQIENPHLIYPGDIIDMTYVDGKPQLRLRRGSEVKLSPKVRTTELEGAIPTIPLDAIFPFLTRPYVVDEAELEAAPYVVDFADEHLVAGAGQKVYVRSVETTDNTNFDVVRPGDAYRDADTNEILGYEALYVGGAQLTRTGDPATLLLTSTEQEVLTGDRLLVTVKDQPMDAFYPKAPDSEINGSIISVLNGVSQIGQYNVVVLDRGTSDGLQVGDVLAIDHKGETVRDDVSPNRWDKVKLPDEKAGHLLVFRTFDRVSFGLVMDATRAIHVLDRVRNP
jgi:hypothetical protein